MVRLGEDAIGNISALADFYEEKGRDDAVRNLMQAVARAAERIGRSPESGLPAPRPYPGVARAGIRWLKEGPYWFAYSSVNDRVILAVVHDQANIPRRL